MVMSLTTNNIQGSYRASKNIYRMIGISFPLFWFYKKFRVMKSVFVFLCFTFLTHRLVWCSRIRASQYNFYRENPNKMQQFIKVLLFLNFKWSSTCFGWHTAHHEEPKTAHAASGFAYVEGCRTCVRNLTTSNNCTSDNLPRIQNQRLRVQF
jgi:hypothetical protein